MRASASRMKLCVDCKHYCGSKNNEPFRWFHILTEPPAPPHIWYLCRHPELCNPCTGAPSDSLGLRTVGKCGRDGTYFEPKEVEE